MPEGTHFIRFAKVRKVKDGMAEWEKDKQKELTEKAKKWVHACGRKGYTMAFIYFKDYRYIMFPEQQEFKDTLPNIFRTFKNIRASVDCTEFKYEMPRNYSQQGNF